VCAHQISAVVMLMITPAYLCKAWCWSTKRHGCRGLSSWWL